MYINISSVSVGGAKLVMDGKCDFSEYADERIATPVSVSVTVSCKAGSRPLLEIRASYSLDLECDRCAEHVTEAHDEVFTHIIGDPGSELGELTMPDARGDLQIDPIVWCDVLCTIPFGFLCRPDCRGLCQNCGKNLNYGPCGCADPKPVTFSEQDITQAGTTGGK